MIKNFYIKTYGCQANIADSLKIAAILEGLGLEEYFVDESQFPNEKALFEEVLPKVDLFIVNTCSVRQKSEDKIYGLGKTLKNLSKKPKVLLSGCVVGSFTGERARLTLSTLTKKTPWVDIYINPSQIDELPKILLQQGFIKNLGKLEKTPKSVGKHAYVNISQGCDNFCTYCVVPYSRGREVSRAREDLLSEIGQLVKKGVNSVTLCGQNVNSWGLTPSQKEKVRIGGGEALPFASLLREIHDLPQIEKIEFISSNPFDFTDDLIDVMKLPKISNYLHIAVQSGNNDVLLAMNRKHTVEEFIALINKLKSVRPTLEIGTDVIVGFPNESYDQFLDTVKLFQTVDFSVAYISMYSPRKGTLAANNLEDNVLKADKKQRHAYLTKIWKETKRHAK